MSEKKTAATVTVTRNGPYIVTGNVPLQTQTIVTNAAGECESWLAGEPFPPAEKYALCRCGRSERKPFCDGTHTRAGFDGTETANRAPYRDQAETFDGPVLALLDARSLCASGRFCDPKSKVWNQVARTNDPEVSAAFVEQVNNCPAGRLTVWDKASRRPIETPLPVSIGLVEDPAEGCSGPIWLRGGISLISADGYAYELRNRMTLCRCGASKNKPFCDGAHISIKFRAS
ncbi:MAG TPA: CDGSH iron-sulfur domain-containing protein [Hyphomicrobiales bacterium]|nr:CDGSH iron-sulfur domain-containing protein [Hyphomicrobiales bacterium]